MVDIDTLLEMLVARGGSDLHLLSGDPPRMRVLGDLEAISEDRLSAKELLEPLLSIMSPRSKNQFEKEDNADFAHKIDGVGRFRVNALRHLNGVGAIFRSIPMETASLEDLSMPEVLTSISKQKAGMILVTGKTGSGKSTTLAAIVNEINNSLKGHILTIEDPVEFVHEQKNCLISQREVGQHAHSFASALHSALREDPDVILVGEMRDLETMSLAVTAAETGILVLGTLHTNSAADTVDRIINSFPTNKQDHIRTMLSTSLRAVISQQLVKTKDGKSRAAAVEIMVNTHAVANTIREGKTDQIDNSIQGGRSVGMQSMDSALKNLLSEDKITAQAAFDAANDKGQFTQFLKKDNAPQ
ncbi:MAG: type IV pilus twitching motility protein PilT [Pseudomonadota bacterium]